MELKHITITMNLLMYCLENRLLYLYVTSYLISPVQQQEPQEPSVRAHRKWFTMTTSWGGSDGKKKAALAEARRVVNFVEVHCSRLDGETRRSSLMAERTRYVCFFSHDDQQTSSTVGFIHWLNSFHRFQNLSTKFRHRFCDFLHQEPNFE